MTNVVQESAPDGSGSDRRPGKRSRDLRAANCMAKADRSWRRTSENVADPKASTTQREATPLPHPQSSNGPEGGAQFRRCNSDKAAPHFQAMRWA